MPDAAKWCSCCELRQNGVGEKGLCPVCTNHQSKEIHQTAKRHEEHVAMLTERLEAASQWANDADEERKKFGDKMHWALKSRDRCIKVLRQISDMHELRSDGACKCGQSKKCKIAGLLDDRGIQTLIRRVDEYEDDQRRREQIWKEIQRDPYAWEDYMRGVDLKDARIRNRDSDTA